MRFKHTITASRDGLRKYQRARAQAQKEKMLLSIFNSAIWDKDCKPTAITLSEVAEKIKSDAAIREMVNTYRGSGDKNIKDQLPHVAFSGVFTGRKADTVEKLNGLVSFDFDGVDSVEEFKATLLNDSAMIPVLMFTSPSGRGVKVVYRVAEEYLKEFKQTYDRIAMHLFIETGELADKATSSITSKCYMSHDPEVHYDDTHPVSDMSRVAGAKNEVRQRVRYESKTHDTDSVVTLVKQIEARQIDITAKYEDWCALGFALANLGELGRDFFHRISKFHPEYSFRECDEKFTELKENSRGDIKIASFFAICKQNGVVLIQPVKVEITAQKAKKIALKASELEEFLNKNYRFRYNMVLAKAEIATKNGFQVIEDRELNSLIRAVKNAGVKSTREQLYQLLCSDFVQMYHPFKDYFDNLPAWDGHDHIGDLAAKVETTDPEYWEFCLRKWLVALVGCATDPKITNQTVLILCGGQGIGKTTFLDRLTPTSLSKYCYSGFIDPTQKDSLIHLAECLVCNLDELESLTRKSETSLKGLITQSAFRIRRPYGISSENLTRHASICGSVNQDSILHDNTGSRRYLIHTVVDIDYSTPVDMEKVYAQAVYLLGNQFRYWFNHDEIGKVNQSNRKYDIISLEEELIPKYFMPADDGVARSQGMSATEVMLHIIAETKLPSSSLNIQKIGKAMGVLGFRKRLLNGVSIYRVVRKY